MSKTKREWSYANKEDDVFTKDTINNAIEAAIDQDEKTGNISPETAAAMRAELEEMRKIAAKEKNKQQSKGSK